MQLDYMLQQGKTPETREVLLLVFYSQAWSAMRGHFPSFSSLPNSGGHCGGPNRLLLRRRAQTGGGSVSRLLPASTSLHVRTEPTPVGKVTTLLHVRTAPTPVGKHRHPPAHDAACDLTIFFHRQECQVTLTT